MDITRYCQYSRGIPCALTSHSGGTQGDAGGCGVYCGVLRAHRHARWKSAALSGKRDVFLRTRSRSRATTRPRTHACVSYLHRCRSVPVVGYIHVCLEMLLYRDVCPAFLSVFVCARASVCVGACVVRTPLRVCLCTRLSVCARVLHFRGWVCVCSTCVFARALRPCWHSRCMTGGLKRAEGHMSFDACHRPQVSPGRVVRPARRGLRELGTRPWSTPPAPSTSSAVAVEASS